MAIQTLVDHVGHFRCASPALSRSSLVSLFMAYSRPSILVASLLGAMLCQCGCCGTQYDSLQPNFFSNFQLYRQYDWFFCGLCGGTRPKERFFFVLVLLGEFE